MSQGGQFWAEVVCHFLADVANQAKVSEVECGGTNNLTRLVSLASDLYVVRVYGGHASFDAILFEHEVLGLLRPHRPPTVPEGGRDGGHGPQLSFQVPSLVPTLQGGEGRTYVRVRSAVHQHPHSPPMPHSHDDGGYRYAAMFEFIEGKLPSFDDLALVRDIGRSIGELVNVLQHLRPERRPAFPRYDDLYHCHLSLDGDRKRVFDFIEQLPVREDVPQVLRLLVQLEADLPAYGALPQQLVHGDITLGNVLCVGSEVRAILDFEFVTIDARVIDMIVMLARLISEEDDKHWERIEAFLAGYGAVAELTEQEVALLPLCLRLRRMITFLHRIAQHWDGQASLGEVCERMRLCLAMERWLTHNSDRLSCLCALVRGKAKEQKRETVY